MQLAATGNDERVGGIGLLHAQADIVLQFFGEPLAQLARRAPRSLFAGKRAGVDAERHPHRRRFHADGRQRARIVRVGNRLADEHFGQAGHGDDLARLSLVHFDAVQSLVDEQLRDLAGKDLSVHRDASDRLLARQLAREQSPDGDAAFVIVIGQRGDEQLRRAIRLDLGRGDIVQNRVEQRLQVRADDARRKRGLSLDRIGIDDGELGLLVRRAQVNE